MKRRALLSLLFLGVAACTAGNRASDSSSAAALEAYPSFFHRMPVVVRAEPNPGPNTRASQRTCRMRGIARF